MPIKDKEKAREYQREWQRKNRNKGKYISYTLEEENLILALVENGTGISEISQKLKRSESAVKGKMHRMGIGYKKKWSKDDEALLIKKHKDGVAIKKIVEILNTSALSVESKITKLGIGAAIGSEELSKKASDRNKKLWGDPNHIFNTEEYRKKLSDTWKDPNSKVNTKEYRQALSDRAKENNPGLRFQHNNSGKGRLTYGGFREDLGHYVRSRWEANVARYLKWLIEKGEVDNYEYEPDRFEFHEIKRGNRSYTPDFKVYFQNRNIEYWEVKGYMDNDSRVKLKRMAKYYPDIKIILIERAQYNEIKKWSGLIPCWE